MICIIMCTNIDVSNGRRQKYIFIVKLKGGNEDGVILCDEIFRTFREMGKS